MPSTGPLNKLRLAPRFASHRGDGRELTCRIEQRWDCRCLENGCSIRGELTKIVGHHLSPQF